MNSVININNISKKYDNSEYILNDFSYSFLNKGFYVLFGESGSGKTTLLNIICGLTKFTNGFIEFNGIKYENQIDRDYMMNYVAYITQRNYFVDYLSVLDNLELCSNNQVEIMKLLNDFSMINSINKFPSELSGGERQRLSLIQALLMNKKIIILDEPTASLDKKNKKIIFDLLGKLKKEILIICSSHDSEVLEYCDEIINFEKIDKYKKTNLHKTINLINIYSNTNHKVKLDKYIKKQNNNNSKNRKSKKLLCGIFILSILIILFCFNTKNKLFKTIEDKYKINYLTIYCPIGEYQDKCEQVFNLKETTSQSFVYSLNIPLDIPAEEGLSGNINFNTDLMTLPLSKTDFPFINDLLYGDYFSKSNDVILGYDMALEYDYDNPQSMIGKNIDIKTPDGINNFKIVGIFKKFGEIEKQYFKSGQIQVESIDQKYFINGDFTKKYVNDEIIGYNEKQLNKAIYYVYFEDFTDLVKVYNENINHKISDNEIYISSFSNQYLDLMQQFDKLSAFLYPIFIIASMIAVFFYFQALQLDNKYNKHIFSVYEYYGYSLKSIKKAILKNNIFSIIKIYGISTIISVLISWIVNYINETFNFINYQIFTFDYLGITCLLVLLILLTIVMSFTLFSSIKSKGWYELVKDSGDLI